MKNPDRQKVSRLEDLHNIGKAIAEDLRSISIDHPKKLAGKDSFELYNRLCQVSGTRYDPCVIDVFIAAVHFMDGSDSLFAPLVVVYRNAETAIEGKRRRLNTGYYIAIRI